MLIDNYNCTNLPKHLIPGALGATCIAYIIYFLFFRPLNLIQGLHRENNNAKKHLISRALQMRKVGELPPPYPNSWYAVLESDEILHGQVRKIFALGRNLVAWRGKTNGQVYVSDPYYPHLGEGGTVNGDCIQCPFHLWPFSGESGKVNKTAYYSEAKDLHNLTGLKLWHVIETNGYVYIWYHAQGHDPTWSPETIKEIDNGQWRYRGRSEFWTTCHIQEIPENGADVAHLQALHESPAVPFEADFLKKLAAHQWSADWRVNDLPNCSHEAIVNISHYISLFGGRFNLLHLNVTVKQIGAGIVILQFITPVGRGVFIQSVTPIEPLIQRITHRFYSEPKFIHPFALLLLYAEGLQIARDIKIWNRKCYLRKPVLVKEDGKIKLFRRWFSQFYSNNRNNRVITEK